jgi:hypothetical protein
VTRGCTACGVYELVVQGLCNSCSVSGLQGPLSCQLLGKCLCSSRSWAVERASIDELRSWKFVVWVEVLAVAHTGACHACICGSTVWVLQQHANTHGSQRFRLNSFVLGEVSVFLPEHIAAG